MIKCTKCNQFRNEDDFYKRKYSKTGRNTCCKFCIREYEKEKRNLFPDEKSKRNKKSYEKHKDTAKKYYFKNKEKIDTYYYNRQSNIKGRLLTKISWAKSRAIKSNLIFDLDLDFLLNLYNNQDGKCAVTGIKFDLKKEKGKRLPFAPSIDRIDYNLGYTKDNVRFVCDIVNLALNRFGEINFDIMCKEYIKNRNIWTSANGSKEE